jgi:enolase-phosphatase E1
MPHFTGISHLLLDIEGTTCPVSFVADTLFPYAAEHLNRFLQGEKNNPEVQRLLSEADQAWQNDSDPEAVTLLRGRTGLGAAEPKANTCAAEGRTDQGVAAYLQLLILQDRKLTALKDLQGLIWQAGYADGDLVAHLFTDVPEALQRWRNAGVQLGVYSSGSVPAQQLLYGHTQNGDLRPLFSHWFDTRTGAKQVSESYRSICQAMHVLPQRVLFISDAVGECEAAHQAGMAVLFSDRPGNPQREAAAFERITDYRDLVIQP